MIFKCNFICSGGIIKQLDACCKTLYRVDKYFICGCICSFKTNNIVNRGISGDYTEGILSRLNEIIYYKPIAVFLLIGVNEFFKDNSNNTEITPAYVADNILKIAEKIKNGSPSTRIYIQTIFPINNPKLPIWQVQFEKTS